MIDNRAVCCARNNADWYEAFFGAHGLRDQRKEYGFVALDNPPPYFSTITVTMPNRTAAIMPDLAEAAKRFAGSVGVKDSFCQLELSKMNFEVLFQAEWIWRAARIAKMPAGWCAVEDPCDLALWEAGWQQNDVASKSPCFQALCFNVATFWFLAKRKARVFLQGALLTVR